MASPGKPDLAVANAGPDAGDGKGSVSVLLGDGNGGFGANTDLAASYAPASVAIADVNRDGKLDLVVANVANPLGGPPGGCISVLLGDGTGYFGAPVNLAAVAGPYFLTLGDVNVDGKL